MKEQTVEYSNEEDICRNKDLKNKEIKLLNNSAESNIN